MSKKTIASALAVLLTISVGAPTAFLIAPQRASAQNATGCLGGLVGSLAGGGGSAAAATVSVPVIDATNAVINGNTSASTWASCINQFVITPLIRSAIRALLQKMTASVVNWINGGNGTGQPSYVQNLPGHLQSVGDTQALAFLAQFGVNSNSPFAAAITSSLSTNYLQNTSSAGFFAANQDTLIRTTGSAANEQAFLNGNWSQGGVGAWFALTTQSQNNPYMLYQASQSELASVVGSAQAARSAELSWGQGFLSWCGAASAPNQPAPAPAGGNGLSPITVTAQTMGTAPGDSCRNADGSYDQVDTPGSIIHDYTQKAVVNSGFEQLISANDLDSALSAVISALLNQVLGGVGGLLGASQTGTGTAPSLTTQLQTYSLSNNASTAGSVTAILQSAVSQTATYSSSWQTIAAAANTALTAVTSLVNSCTAYAAAVSGNQIFLTSPTAQAAAATAQAAAARNAITTEINPVLAQANTAGTISATIQAMIQEIQNELNSRIPYAADLQTLQTMPPTTSDVSSALQNAQSTGSAAAVPAGSLTVSGGTIVDRMTLITTNATALRASVCP